MMLSLELIREVLREVRYFPYHAYKVTSGRLRTGVYPHEKYNFGQHRRQYLCWFDPPKVAKDQIIIFYHGGGWTFGTPELFSDRARLFGEQGYQVIMPAHRKLPYYGYKEIREDLILTLNKVYEIMDNKGLLHKKIILSGMSSGGNLAALLLLDHSLLAETPFDSNQFSGALLCAAPVNLEGMTDSFVLKSYAGKKKSELFQKASPINHLPTTFSKPILLVHGTNDGLVKYQSTADFVQELEKRSTLPIEFHTIEKGSHLKAVSWAYKDDEIRKIVLDWLKKL